jgi:hypothetical protein
MKLLTQFLYLVVPVCAATPLAGQSSPIPFQKWVLEDMSTFRKQAGNWRIVGDVQMDRNVDVPKNGNTSIQSNVGTGILLNLNDETKKDALLSQWEHGDMDLELEFMLPKGSNSGIYFQGRYELQLYDSWGIKQPKFSDLGGIYRNWEREKGQIYMGKAPLANAAKAPGLWQKMFIAFRAPRFDASGQKIANARIVQAVVNGVVIHENIEIPLPTGGPIEKNEKAFGPLMIQGDHGAVAFRNMQYRLYDADKIQLSDIKYRFWQYRAQYDSDYKDKTPLKTGNLTALNLDFLDGIDTFGIHYTAKMTVPQTTTYHFTIASNGGSVLNIDGKNVITNHRAWVSSPKLGEILLTAGVHELELFYHRHDTWLPTAFQLTAEAAKMEKYPLNDPSTFLFKNVTSPVLVRVGNEPKMLRAFLDFKNNRKLRRTHTVGVGDPSGVHYIFDAQLGVLSGVWRGAFVDATPMWHDRGDGSFKPLGDIQYLFNTPQFAVLSDKQQPFPKEWDESNFKPKGYRLEENTNRPIFRYVVNGLEIEDKSFPDETKSSLMRELSVKGIQTGVNAYFRLAQGKEIQLLADGSYRIDNQYYIQNLGLEKAFIRDADGQKELVVGANNGIKYLLIW